LKLTAYIDGSSLGNPGESGYGIVLMDENGNILKSIGRYIGRATNNVAEYQALIGCLEFVETLNVKRLTVYSDSQLLVNQINGSYRIKKSHLQKLHSRILQIIEKAELDVEIQHIYREKNKDADRLARKAVQLKTEVVEE